MKLKKSNKNEATGVTYETFEFQSGDEGIFMQDPFMKQLLRDGKPYIGQFGKEARIHSVDVCEKGKAQQIRVHLSETQYNRLEEMKKRFGTLVGRTYTIKAYPAKYIDDKGKEQIKVGLGVEVGMSDEERKAYFTELKEKKQAKNLVAHGQAPAGVPSIGYVASNFPVKKPESSPDFMQYPQVQEHISLCLKNWNSFVDSEFLVAPLERPTAYLAWVKDKDASGFELSLDDGQLISMYLEIVKRAKDVKLC